MSCYKAIEKLDIWIDAHQSCSASGGDLVKIEDDDEQRFMVQYMGLTGLKKGQDVSVNSLTVAGVVRTKN